ncbi:MAG: zinc ribbon-containing protein [Gammaproteobacteria bacterium]|nr:zinc ribbon-containing protein [Gammaproteobacteria bacterium]MCW8911564.1 zinc ribbon-containing protein [Gammaproteobacteria bacterium]MCW9005438.1 zinc ribbon-containing protein [Gammaproteobacteria bacterium]
MSANNNHDNSLIDAYNQMMARIKDSIESAEAHAVPTLQKAIDHAKQQAIHLGEITLEDAEEIGNYIKRDINDAAEYLMETSHEFSEWLMLDIDIIEQKVLELFLSVADKTRIELEQLAHPSCKISQYHTGEITGPGSLICEACGEMIHFTTTGHIPPCPKCKKTRFKRAEI